MDFRSRAFPVVVLLVVLGLVAAACGGDKSYKAGTPAATGQAPDCSIIPADLAGRMLKKELTGPVAEPTRTGSTCTYPAAKGGGGGVADQVQLHSNADKETMARFRDGLSRAKNPVKRIKGYGDEAYAATVYSYADINNFAARKGKVSVVIISTAEYNEIEKLMKAILAKL